MRNLILIVFFAFGFAHAYTFKVGEKILKGSTYYTVLGFYPNGNMGVSYADGTSYPYQAGALDYAKTSGCEQSICVDTKLLKGSTYYLVSGFYYNGNLAIRYADGTPYAYQASPSDYVIISGPQETVKLLPLDQVNKLLQPSEGLMVILGQDLRVPKGAGYGSVKDSTPVQCWVGQTEKSNNSIRYKSQRTLKIGTIKMADDRKDIRLQILDDEDLNEVSCTSNTAINIKAEADLGKILDASGLTLQEPPEIVKEKK